MHRQGLLQASAKLNYILQPAPVTSGESWKGLHPPFEPTHCQTQPFFFFLFKISQTCRFQTYKSRRLHDGIFFLFFKIWLNLTLVCLIFSTNSIVLIWKALPQQTQLLSTKKEAKINMWLKRGNLQLNLQLQKMRTGQSERTTES